MNELSQITGGMYSDKGIRVKNNPLGLSAAEAQRAFDELSLDVVIPAFNSLVSEQNTINTDVEGRVSSLETELVLKADQSAVLTKTNTDEFIPTADYQPATKRYVDLNVIQGGVPQTRTVNGYPLTSDVNLTSGDVGALSPEDASGISPLMDGTAQAGSSQKYARADHVHPSDAAKQNAASRMTSATTSVLTLEDNKEYVLTMISSLTLSYPGGNFECWLKVKTRTSGTVTIKFPSSAYIGYAPTFGNDETWEISIKDGVIIAQKVGDGQ